MEDLTHDRLEEVFAEALGRPAAERAAFVRAACRDDQGLRAEVESLLRAHDRIGGFLAGPEQETPTKAAASAMEGRRVGRYHVRRQIASGGMGLVYEAVQEQPHRTVALKLMRTGVVSGASLRRFEYETQVLARLRHAHIAQIYEAGTYDDDGHAVPFFAMEYIPNAKSLLEYADEKRLGVRERLGLFTRVCEAVHHGHQKGIIHRDLKPANILVDSAGDPKIIDFGVARATDSDMAVTTLQTDVGQIIGTLQYMSPEQCAADPHDLDSRSDVYALGVVLYELLCGRLPYDLTHVAPAEAARVIRDETPPRPSTGNRTLRGDVETILLKALAKDRTRRYASAHDLARDIDSYLNDQPIIARRPSVRYQLSKFAHRNKALVGGLALAFAALALGTVVATWQAMHARAQANEAQAINTFLTRMFALANPREELDDLADSIPPDRALTIVELLDEASSELATAFPDWPEVRADLHFRVGKTYGGLGREEQGRFHLQRAYELRREVLGATHPDTLVALTWWAMAFPVDASADAVRLLRQAVEGLRQEVGPEDRRTLSATTWLANTLVEDGKVGEGEQLFRETIDLAGRHLGETDRTTLTAIRLYGWVLVYSVDRYQEAERLLGDALLTCRRNLPAGDLVTADLARNLGGALQEQGRHEEALEFLQQAYEGERTGKAGVSQSAIRSTNMLCSTLRSLGRASEAEELLRQQIQDCRQELGDEHKFTFWSRHGLAEHLQKEGRQDETEAILRKALDDHVPRDQEGRAWQFLAERELARLHDARGRLDEAELWLRRALDSLRHAGDDDVAFYGVRNELAWFLKDRGPEKLVEAETLARESVESRRRIWGESNSKTVGSMDTLAVILHLQGRNEEAVAMFEDVVGAARSTVGDARWHTVVSATHYLKALSELTGRTEVSVEDGQDIWSVLEALIKLYDAWGDPEEAAEYRALLREVEGLRASD
ncbi:MAG: tetratricopeptide repeat protein [Planctomycetota bacterium]|jgi:tetratricopeptide (TPR) repeat protein